MSQIDAVDAQILAALQDNGRLTMKSLAEQVGLSSPAMIERVRRLEERGILTGYRAVVDPAAIGRLLTAFVSCDVPAEHLADFISLATSHPSVTEVHRTLGEMNTMVRVSVADMLALEALLDEFGALGVRCVAQPITSTPLSWRAITGPDSPSSARTRSPRRRRDGAKAATNGNGETTSDTPKRRPGRPRRNPVE